MPLPLAWLMECGLDFPSPLPTDQACTGQNQQNCVEVLLLASLSREGPSQGLERGHESH